MMCGRWREIKRDFKEQFSSLADEEKRLENATVSSAFAVTVLCFFCARQKYAGITVQREGEYL